MGLDMYLNRFPRYNNVSAEQINIIESYLEWLEKGSKYTFKEWCGCSENDLPSKEVINYFKNFYKTYHIGDNYEYHRISEEVGYWRKCNAIHQWFVDHVQDGIDDCSYHHEVTKEILEWLRKSCATVINASKLVPGKLYNGTTFKDGQAFAEYIDGTVIENTSVAEELLPTQDGFFFGGTSYDEWYIDGLKQTIEIIDNVLATTDFETQMIYYVSSW